MDATVEALATTTGARVLKRQVEQRVQRAAVDFTAWYADTELSTEPATTVDVLMLTLDSKGVVMRAQDLREATRKAAQQSKPKLSLRLSKGEKRHRKRYGRGGSGIRRETVRAHRGRDYRGATIGAISPVVCRSAEVFAA